MADLATREERLRQREASLAEDRKKIKEKEKELKGLMAQRGVPLSCLLFASESAQQQLQRSMEHVPLVEEEDDEEAVIPVQRAADEGRSLL